MTGYHLLVEENIRVAISKISLMLLTISRNNGIMATEVEISLFGGAMKHIFYAEFEQLLSEYRNATSREDKLIKHRLDSIVSLYENCSVDECEFADEITLEFSRIVALLKNQYKHELIEITKKYESIQEQNDLRSTYVPTIVTENSGVFEYDFAVLEAFYNHYLEKGQLPYYQIDGYVFESSEERKRLVNLTMWDYCNRIKTFAKKYLFEIFPEETIPSVIHGEDAENFETFEPIVFIFNNLEVILAKIKTTNEMGETVKQRLNIRSALRRLNEFKQTLV